MKVQPLAKAFRSQVVFVVPVQMTSQSCVFSDGVADRSAGSIFVMIN